MLAPPPAISVPFNTLIRSDSPAISTPQELSAPPRFPHTRAQLTAIARQYRPLDNYDDDNEDGSSRITSALVARVASLLESEREEDIKNLLKDSFGPNIEDDEVRVNHLPVCIVPVVDLSCTASCRSTCWTSCTDIVTTWTMFLSYFLHLLVDLFLGRLLGPPLILLA